MRLENKSETNFSLFIELAKLAIPLFTAQLAYMAMQLVDTLMMGQLGAPALAVGALGGVIIYNILVFCMGILSAVGILIAQSHGEKNDKEICCSLANGILLAMLLSIPCVALIKFIPAVLLFFGLEKILLDSTKIFLDALAWGIPSSLIFVVLRDFISVFRSARIVMIISILAVPLNALLNYILMYGKLAFPVLGIAGIGYATSIVRWGMLFSLILYLYLRKDFFLYFQSILKYFLNWKKIKKILLIGCPSGVMMGLEIGMFSVITVMMGYFGIVALAAHQIANQCANVVFTLPLGISQAASILVGHAVGNNSQKSIRQVAWLAIGMGSIISIFIAFVFCFFPLNLSQIFLNIDSVTNASVKTLVVSFLFMAAILQFLDSAQVISIGILRGLNDTLMSMVLGIVAYWGVGLTCSYIFAFVFKWQGLGLWCGLCLGIGVSTILLLLRFYKITLKYYNEH